MSYEMAVFLLLPAFLESLEGSFINLERGRLHFNRCTGHQHSTFRVAAENGWENQKREIMAFALRVPKVEGFKISI